MSRLSGTRDVALNTISFGLIIGVQQLVIMPVLSRLAPDAHTFSLQIVYLTITTMIVNIVGVELGNTALARAPWYARKFAGWDFLWILPILVAGAAAIVGAFVLVWHPDDGSALGYVLVVVLGIVRSFWSACLRYRNRFAIVLWSSFGYAVGALAGVALSSATGLLSLPFVLGEIASTFLVLASRPWLGVSFAKPSEGRPGSSDSMKLFGQLATISALMNFVSYFDRLLAFPLLGASALAVYYASSVMAKTISMVTNPAAGAILARLAVVSDGAQGTVTRRLLRFVGPAFIVFSTVNVFASFAGLYVLYPHLFDDAEKLVIPVAIGAAASSASDLLKPILIRFHDGRKFVLANILYAGIFAVSVFIFSHWWGLVGFAWSVVVGRGVQLAAYTVMSLRSRL